MEKIRVGVIGVGAMGKHHARIYSKLEEAELVGVMDVNPFVAKEIAELYKTRAFDDYSELLSLVDAVSIWDLPLSNPPILKNLKTNSSKPETNNSRKVPCKLQPSPSQMLYNNISF